MGHQKREARDLSSIRYRSAEFWHSTPIPYLSSNVARLGHDRRHWPMTAFGRSFDVSAETSSELPQTARSKEGLLYVIIQDGSVSDREDPAAPRQDRCVRFLGRLVLGIALDFAPSHVERLGDGRDVLAPRPKPRNAPGVVRDSNGFDGSGSRQRHNSGADVIQSRDPGRPRTGLG